MPTYDYTCPKCKKAFSITESITVHSACKVSCSQCKNTAVERVYQSFFAVTQKKS